MIFLTGFMGSGKSTVGRKLAALLEMPFTDLDTTISKKAGTSIPDIFRCAGEEAFRFLERKALLDIARRAEPCVVATGGGLPVNPLNRRIMKACGVIVHLQTSFESIMERVSDDQSRPLWNKDSRALFESRKGAYDDADLIVGTDTKTVEQITGEISAAVSKFVRITGVILPENPYPVYTGKGIFKDVLPLLERHAAPEGLFVLADENVLKHHGKLIEETLGGQPHVLMPVPSGEESKSSVFLNKVLAEMFSCRVNRQWVCLAIGGGVTGDLAGFAASIYMRGIPVVHVATTLLSQTDSSIGGKTGINNEFGKNLVGSFCQPLFVLSDVNFLATLDPAQLKSAMAEVIKYGIIMDSELFEYIEKNKDLDFEKIVRMCARDKARIVSEDEREGGLRRILNFGHTLGHAVEKSTGYTVLHGEAVALGMLFAAWLSLRRGMLPRAAFDRIRSIMDREAIIPASLTLPGPEEAAEAMSLDKKAGNKGIQFVLTPFIGDVSVQKLTEIEVLEAYKGFADGYARGL